MQGQAGSGKLNGESSEVSALPAPHKIAGLIAWVRRDEWREVIQEWLSHHTAMACAEAGQSLAELEDLLGEYGFATIWGATFEDLVASDLPDGRNLADDYLRRHGWKESTATREYIMGLRHSVISLYEVSGLVPGESMALKDLVRGGNPIRVLEKSGSQGLRQWDRIATRVIRLRDCNVISGTLMHFKRENSDVLIGRLNRLKKQAAKGTQRHNKKYERGSDQGVHPDRSAVDQLLVRAAPLFTNLWLEEAISDARPTKLPELHNAEGDPIAFSKLHFPLRQGVTAEQVIKALNQIPSLRSEGDGFWNWLAPPGRKPQALPAGAVGQTLISTMDDGSLVLGVVTLEGRRLTLETNSEARAARGRTLLAPIMQNLVGPPLSEHVDLLRLLEQSREKREPLTIAPEDQQAVMHKTMDDHYRRVIEEPIPALGNKSPRGLVKTPKGRERVADWIKTVENHSAHRPPEDPMRGYDTSWLWRELGVEDLRN